MGNVTRYADVSGNRDIQVSTTNPLPTEDARAAAALEAEVVSIPPMDSEAWSDVNGWDAVKVAVTGAGAATLGAADPGHQWIVGGWHLSFSAAGTFTGDDAAFASATADHIIDIPGACIYVAPVGGIAPLTIATGEAAIIRNSAGNMKGVAFVKKVAVV